MADGLVYKFYSERWGLDALYRRRLKVTTLADINDPFEFLATHERREIRAAAHKMRSQHFGEEGVICFSKNWHEPLMWSHYADCHKGIALGFSLFNPRNGFDVEYSDERVQMPALEPTEFGESLRYWDQIRVRKYRKWEYENEVRVFPSLDASIYENGLYFRNFSDFGELKTVVLGPEYRGNRDIDLHKKLEKVGVCIITSRLGFQKFEVVEQKAKKFQKYL